jgi:hypothetical protein
MPVSLAYASDDETVNLADFPQKLADALNVSLLVGQLLASLIFMSLFLLPSMLIAGYFGGVGAVLFVIITVGLGTSVVCVALGWMPVWVLFVIALMEALLLAGSLRDLVTGRGTR